MKFSRGNQYREQIKMITSWAKLEQQQGSRIREKIRIDVSGFSRHVKHVMTPSEWIHKLTTQTTEDAIAYITQFHF